MMKMCLSYYWFPGLLFFEENIVPFEVKFFTTLLATIICSTCSLFFLSLSSIPKLVYLSKISHPLFAIPLAVLYLRSLPSRGISTILNWIVHVPHFSCSLLCHILAFKFLKHSWSLSHCHFKVVSRYTLVGFSKKVNANLGKLSYEQEICPIISSTIFVPEMGILKVIRVDLTFDW